MDLQWFRVTAWRRAFARLLEKRRRWKGDLISTSSGLSFLSSSSLLPFPSLFARTAPAAVGSSNIVFGPASHATKRRRSLLAPTPPTSVERFPPRSRSFVLLAPSSLRAYHTLDPPSLPASYALSLNRPLLILLSIDILPLRSTALQLAFWLALWLAFWPA